MYIKGYRRAFESGRSFQEFLEAARANRELWDAMARRADPDPAAVRRIRSLGGGWRLLALADDWCGDAVNILPVVSRLVDEAEGLELRIVGREEHPGLMERHLTGDSRSIPVLVLLDSQYRPHGWWGPRPRELQAWFEAEGRSLPKEERYRKLRRWYARDRGVAVSSEIADLLWCGATGEEPPYRGTRPCPSLRAA